MSERDYTDTFIGPTPKEASCAFRVAQYADRFLNAYLTNGRPSPEDVRELAVALFDLESETAGGVCLELRADDLECAVDWSKAQAEPGPQPRFILPEADA